MTTRHQRLRNAEHINYGFLAVKSAESLEKFLKDSPLTPEDLKVLEKSKDFFHELSEGVELVSTGTYSGGNSIASMQALDFAIGPLEVLQDALQDKKLSDLASAIENKIDLVIKNRKPTTKSEREVYSNLVQFFHALNESLLEDLSRSRIHSNRRHGSRAAG